jgi:hypothetical protein
LDCRSGLGSYMLVGHETIYWSTLFRFIYTDLVKSQSCPCPLDVKICACFSVSSLFPATQHACLAARVVFLSGYGPCVCSGYGLCGIQSVLALFFCSYVNDQHVPHGSCDRDLFALCLFDFIFHTDRAAVWNSRSMGGLKSGEAEGLGGEGRLPEVVGWLAGASLATSGCRDGVLPRPLSFCADLMRYVLQWLPCFSTWPCMNWPINPQLLGQGFGRDYACGVVSVDFVVPCCCDLEFSENLPPPWIRFMFWERTIFGSYVLAPFEIHLIHVSIGWAMAVAILQRGEGAVSMMLWFVFCLTFWASWSQICAVLGGIETLCSCSLWSSPNPSINRMSTCWFWSNFAKGEGVVRILLGFSSDVCLSWHVQMYLR